MKQIIFGKRPVNYMALLGPGQERDHQGADGQPALREHLGQAARWVARQSANHVAQVRDRFDPVPLVYPAGLLPKALSPR